MISAIVPIYNEEKVLSENAFDFQELSLNSELIFVDGQSDDRSRQIAARYGMVFLARKGRAAQMNYGAGLAKGDILLFLHADTRVSVSALDAVARSMQDERLAGGCLSQRIDAEGFIYRCIEAFGNIRARLTKVFYGDQGIFVRKDVFLEMKGFPEIPVMEDVVFSKKLRMRCRTAVLKDEITVSARRWKKEGIVKTIATYSWLNILFWLKTPFSKIKLFYSDLR